DWIFAYPLNTFFENTNLYKLKKIKPIHLFLFSLGYSFVNYGFQLILDKKQPTEQQIGPKTEKGLRD
ncbi:hypothetical protein V7138_23175, partial [Bacillus sp. JJ1533]